MLKSATIEKAVDAWWGYFVRDEKGDCLAYALSHWGALRVANRYLQAKTPEIITLKEK